MRTHLIAHDNCGDANINLWIKDQAFCLVMSIANQELFGPQPLAEVDEDRHSCVDSPAPKSVVCRNGEFAGFSFSMVA